MECLLDGNRSDAPSSQEPATSFALPRVLDSSDAVKDAATLPADATSSQQQHQNTANTHNEPKPLYHSDEVVCVTTGSANRVSTDQLNVPADTSKPGCSLHLAAAASATQATNAVLLVTAAAEEGGPLPRRVSSAQLAPSDAVPSSSVPPRSASSVASETVATGTWNHALVAFDKLFCVCFVPLSLRPLRVGELVQCEFDMGDNIATVIADVSSLVTVVAAATAAERLFGFNSPRPPPTGATYRNTSPLYRGKLVSGLAADYLLTRLPSLIRRGTNRDKKRVYFARLRSNDALAVAQHELLSRAVTAQAAEYQVNFTCATIYLAGDRSQCVLSAQQLVELAEALLEKLRCEKVEFRFWGEHTHEELDLTRVILGNQYTEVLYDRVVEYQRTQSSRSTQRATAQVRATRQPTTAGPPPPPPPLQQPQQQQQQQQQQPLSASASFVNQAPDYPGPPGWSHPATVSTMSGMPTMTVLQQSPASPSQPVSYTLGTSIYVAQQPQQPSSVQSLSSSQPLSFVSSSSYPALQHAGAAPVTYVARRVPTSYYESQPQQLSQQQQQPPPQQQQQQQQPTLTLSSSTMAGSPVYYVVPSSAAVQWDRQAAAPLGPGHQQQFQQHPQIPQFQSQPSLSPPQQQQQQHYLQQMPPPGQAHVSPTLFCGPDGGVTQPSLQSPTAYVQTSPLNAQGYQTVSYPLLLSPTGVSYQPYHR